MKPSRYKKNHYSASHKIMKLFLRVRQDQIGVTDMGGDFQP